MERRERHRASDSGAATVIHSHPPSAHRSPVIHSGGGRRR
jgi:hypothetical protein